MTLKDVSVIIPTRDCKHMLEPALGTMLEWAAQVGELIIVDSSTKDQTYSYLRQNFSFPNAKFYVQPPGLYAAWNFGIQQATKSFIYISTAGDAISKFDLEYLLNIASKTGADVVVSPPKFYDAKGEPKEHELWPIHDLFLHFQNDDIVELSPLELTLFAMRHSRVPVTNRSWLGSSASNLYRTKIMQVHPFPLNCGHGGDTIFGLLNARYFNAAFCQRICGKFILHTDEIELERAECRRLYALYSDAFDNCLDWLKHQLEANSIQLTSLMQTWLCEMVQADRERMRTEMRYAVLLEDEHDRMLSEMAKKLESKGKYRRLKAENKKLKASNTNSQKELKRIHRKLPSWIKRFFNIHIPL